MILERIQSPEDVKRLNEAELDQLCAEIRAFLVSHVSRTGGHLSANLGVVELTVAITRTFDFPKDGVVFDVGHQSYVYKMLTGRRDEFDRLRQANGLGGFPRREESIYDVFDTGHASTSVSVAYGRSKAMQMRGEEGRTIALVGDGALTGGLAYEALNQAGKDGLPLIVILNDNNLSIGPNVGAVARHLSTVRTRKSYLNFKRQLHSLFERRYGEESRIERALRTFKRRIKYFLLAGVFFEELGFTYLGPVDGHNLDELDKALEQAKRLNEPVVLHVRTKKGKGYAPAENDPADFHGIGPFDVETGKELAETKTTWASVVGHHLIEMAAGDPDVAVVCAAMPQGTGVSGFAKQFPNRYFDTGIAEEHAVTFSAGLACGGLKPFFVVYSTFLQRAYDELLHDVCIGSMPVRLLIDHAGIVGEDGPTHQGVFDLAFLGTMPNMTVLAPSSKEELVAMMDYAHRFSGPIAIRYPKGACLSRPMIEPIESGRGTFVRRGDRPTKTLVIALGDCVTEALETSADVYDARFAVGFDPEYLRAVCRDYEKIVTIEDHVYTNGFGMRVRDALYGQKTVTIVAVPDTFVPQGKRCDLLKQYGISAAHLQEVIDG